MYYLILIISLVANGASVQIEEIEFGSKRDCQEALIQILREHEKKPTATTNIHIDGWCMKKG